jgi:hypothetical protein
MQYFEGIACPDNVNVPTEDGDAWRWNPEYKWVYDKLAVAESQGLACAPHGIDPDTFPVFSKPIYNMRGMGAGSGVLRTAREYKQRQRPGHFWMQLLEGEHVSTDVAVVNGEVKWQRHSAGTPLDGGMFDYWTVLAAPKPRIETYLANWVSKHMSGYTGMLNLETIDATIIEVHMRFADQWPDLYGDGWVEALVKLYAENTWAFDDHDRQDGYSVVLFGTHGVQYRHPPPEIVARLRATEGVLSVQVTFHEDRPPASHSMPPGGFRLAIVNTFNLDLGRRIRQELALSFWSTQQLIHRRRKSG